ncbi:hypothetical protein N0V83_010961 [Neocucurbitaria cava]|uniref:Cysteine dioxygenase n=1 Tax=Neocucurbitaria cava TaxID=798079 RepID=A0A9W8XZC5_9PLEO|nr:hypothetical protein N0V83_010961 [Neocucurbitaria cava]
MPGVTTEQDKFQTLVQTLREKLGPCSGIDSEDVDPRELQQLMEEYNSDESEWAKYYFPSSTIPYTRNLVDKGNGKSNLVLKGSLVETRFAWPTQHLNNSEDRPLQVISEKTYEENQVTYMSDKLGLHRIKNPNPNDYAISLHCWSTSPRNTLKYVAHNC